jgi:hypothetical protein
MPYVQGGEDKPSFDLEGSWGCRVAGVALSSAAFEMAPFVRGKPDHEHVALHLSSLYMSSTVVINKRNVK